VAKPERPTLREAYRIVREVREAHEARRAQRIEMVQEPDGSWTPRELSTLHAWRHTQPIRPTTRHYVSALGALAVVATTALTLTTVPMLDVSIIGLVARLLTDVPILAEPELGSVASRAETVAVLAFLGLVIFLHTGRKSGRGVNHYAMKEERAYRAGAESWSWPRRAWVTLRFGLAHIWNLIIPLGVALALALGGAWFLAAYLRAHRASGSRVTALQHSAAVHAAYNTLLLVVILPAAIIGSIIRGVLTA